MQEPTHKLLSQIANLVKVVVMLFFALMLHQRLLTVNLKQDLSLTQQKHLA